jgi:hypothetical protein
MEDGAGVVFSSLDASSMMEWAGSFQRNIGIMNNPDIPIAIRVAILRFLASFCFPSDRRKPESSIK